MAWEPKACIATREGNVQYYFRGEGIPRRLQKDNINLMQLLGVTWVSLLSDSPVDPLKPKRVVNKFFYELENDALQLISRLAGLAQELIRSFVVDETGHTIDIVFIEGMRDTPVFREYLHFYRTRDPIVLRYLYTFLVYGSKLKVKDPRLERDALRAWLDVEDSLSKVVLDSDLVAQLREIVAVLFDCWDEADFLPVHGSGAVAERGVRSIQEKNVNFSIPAKVKRLYGGLDEHPFPSEWKVGDLPECVSRLKFVPKSYKSMRSICMEPVGLQWSQQAVRLWMEDVISESLRGFVNLRDQRLNKSAAEFGSMTQLVDTIDLSSASDSVLWDLVKQIFPVKVVKHLLATRSQFVELPSGKIFKILKYAPMGSSLCFPTQTILYSAVVILATIKTHLGSSGDFDDVVDEIWEKGLTALFYPNLSTLADTFQPFRCFGDDIICDKRVTSNTIDILTQLGFKVNAEKSFVGHSAFRESCGGHYFLGFDVTPFYFRIPTFGSTMSIECLESTIDAANYARQFGYLKLRSAIINFVLRYPTSMPGSKKKNLKKEATGLNPVLFSNDINDSMAIFCEKPRNTHLIRREAMSCGTALTLQRAEIRSLSVKAKCDDEVVVFSNYHYTAWCRSRRHSAMEPTSLSGRGRTGTVDAVPCWRWTPTG